MTREDQMGGNGNTGEGKESSGLKGELRIRKLHNHGESYELKRKEFIVGRILDVALKHLKFNLLLSVVIVPPNIP